MAKNRNKKKTRDGVASMDVSEPTTSSQPLEMDTSENVAVASTSGAPKSSADIAMKAKKGRPMKRSKNVRKKLAIAKAVSKTEQSLEKVSKKQNKVSRAQSAKLFQLFYFRKHSWEELLLMRFCNLKISRSKKCILISPMIAVAGLVLASGVLIWAFKNFMPPPPTLCGTPNGPPVTSPRIKLDDGRHLAYKEIGVAKEKATYKVILVHGIDSSKDLYLPLPQEMLEELGIYVLTFDRAGYGESDPNPRRSLKSDTFDIQELADKLELGPKFFLIGLSIGSYTTWGCLKYLPHRLAGVALVVPVTNYWWPSFPPKLAAEGFNSESAKSKMNLRVAHHFPALLHWWMNHKMELDPSVFSRRDIETIKNMSQIPMPNTHKVRQQGIYGSLFRDMKIGFGKWEFDPMELSNPFPDKEASVHLWQGYEDNLVPYKLQRYVINKLPWINYHEVPDGGHLIIHEGILCQAIFRTLLLGEKPSL